MRANASNIVYPAVARRVLQKVCKERGIKVYNAPGEADWFLAKKVIKVITDVRHTFSALTIA